LDVASTDRLCPAAILVDMGDRLNVISRPAGPTTVKAITCEVA